MLRVVLIAAVCACSLTAEPRHMVDYLLPRGGGVGATVTAEIHGSFLENPREVLFYGSGITASDFVPFSRPGDGFKVKFHIAPDCPVGEHVLRVRTATSLSDAVTFWVSRFPTEYEFEDKPGQNDTIATAKPIPMNVTVEGQILPGPDPDVDVYRVLARQGQHISVEVEAARLGTLHYGGENDLAVRILDQNGKELGRDDDSALYVQDPVLSVIAPADGAYYVEIRQQIYDPPRMAWYRAHIGTFSRPTAIFPAGGEAGTAISARILGDPAGERTESIALPKATGNFNYFGDAPSPNVLRVSPYPNVIWPANNATLPAALNGILDQPGATHIYRFAAKKGQAWHVRVFARTLGAPVDPRIWIRAANGGRNLVDADDSRLPDLGRPSMRGTWHVKDQEDPVAVFRAPADGEYLLGIADTTGAAGPDHVYRVEIEPLRDTIYTHITMPDGYQLPRLTGLIVPQGNRWTLDVQLAPQLGNTYKGDLELAAEGLPKGVTMIAPRVTKGLLRVPVQFAAADDAPPAAALIRILARPVDPSVPLQSGSRQAFALINRPGELPWHCVFLDRYALAVVDPVPFHVTLVPPAVPLMQGSDLILQVRVEGTGAPLEVQPDWLPPGVSHDPAVTVRKEGAIRIQANDKAAPGVYRIAVNASTTGGDAYSGVGRSRVSSEFVELRIAEPYLSLDLQRTSVERGKRGEIVAVVKVNRPFEGKAKLTLRQLPRGVRQVGTAEIAARDKEAVLHIEADPDALAGMYTGISCEIEFQEGGQTIRSHSGNGALRVDLPRSSL